MREVEKLMPFLHLPVQSGSDRILKAMNRSHTADSYLRIIDRVRAARPDIAISGDFIVGFPGETDADFEETLKIVEAVNYAQAFSFKYSRRPGTPAATMEDQVPARSDGRTAAAAAGPAQRPAARLQPGERRAAHAVLLERPGRKPGQLIGKSPWLQSVHLETGAAIGDMRRGRRCVSAGPEQPGRRRARARAAA